MFWGVTLDSGKRYTQTVEKSFHLSMAALGFQNCSSLPVTVMVEVDKAQFALCTLQPGKIPQQPLDYCFTEGEEITFFMEGPGDVHLTGYLMDEPNALEFEEDEEELSGESEESETASAGSDSEDEDESSSDEITLSQLLQSGDIENENEDNEEEDEESGDDDWDPSKDNPKRKKRNKKDKKKKNSKKDHSERQDESMNEEETESDRKLLISSFDDDNNDNDDDDGEDDDDEEWSPDKKVNSDSKAVKMKVTKQQKRKLKRRENETVENGETQPQKLTKKAKKKLRGKEKAENVNSLDSNKQSQNSASSPVKPIDSLTNSSDKQLGNKQGSPTKNSNQSQATETTKRKLPGGTVVEDLKRGQGQTAKKGQTVHVYYKGNLAKNKKQFDSCLSGRPFSFRLGAGEVIKGWDLGVAGMQVGGKRRLTVPPSQGYGNKKMGPIPPNSTLEFEIQLIKLQ
ncbi:46 kDa FK506-binding nuclear protein-like [Porites lutea]|uniref:46 kDa FK506-binding nuclear protein-like n=1 Tax=Porites lutea TaxID=51062 RepID=UPI003CC62122